MSVKHKYGDVVSIVMLASMWSNAHKEWKFVYPDEILIYLNIENGYHVCLHPSLGEVRFTLSFNNDLRN
jgi:hypothetical protein